MWTTICTVEVDSRGKVVHLNFIHHLVALLLKFLPFYRSLNYFIVFFVIFDRLLPSVTVSYANLTEFGKIRGQPER